MFSKSVVVGVARVGREDMAVASGAADKAFALPAYDMKLAKLAD